MKVASIDIGSNTVLMLIAEFDPFSLQLRTIDNFYRAPRISAGLNSQNNISHQKINELKIVLEEYLKIAEANNCEQIIANATNAFRIAKNSNEILYAIKSEFGIDIQIISGEEEALLSLIGSIPFQDDSNNYFVLDIGGGSTELIIGNFNKILYRKSFPVGAVNITEKNITVYPISTSDEKNIREFLNNIFNEIIHFSNLNLPLISVAGTPTTLACISQGISEYSEAKVEGFVLDLNEIKKIGILLKTLFPEEINIKFGSVVYGREDVLYAGTAILTSVMSMLNINNTIVSSRGLRYGAVIDYIRKKK